MSLPSLPVNLPPIVLTGAAKNTANETKIPILSENPKITESGKNGISIKMNGVSKKVATKPKSKKAPAKPKAKPKGKGKDFSDEEDESESMSSNDEENLTDEMTEKAVTKLPPSTNLPTSTLVQNQSEETVEELEKKFKNALIDPEASYFYTFVDGSAIRYLVDYLTLISEEGTFIFKPDEIVYQKGDEDGSILNDVRIKPYKLIDREFKSTNPEILTTISFAQLKNKTRTVGKKEQMDIYRRSEEPNNFYIQVRSQEKNSDPVFYRMSSRTESVEVIELPPYKRDKRNPNCTVFQADFNKTCKALHANKCAYAEFTGYEKGLIIKGYDSKGGIVMVKEFGKCKNNDVSKSSTTKGISGESDVVRPQVNAPRLKVVEELEKVRVSAKIYKALIKVNGFTGPNTTLNFYIEKDAPIKIVAPIGTFGKLTILIR